jgi:hypothetical protein
MAGEIQVPYGVTGKTVKVVVRNSLGQPYNTVTPGFEAYNAVNYANYSIALAEQGASGVYVGNMPVVAAGTYSVVARDQAGGSPAESDPVVGAGQIEWAGTAVAYLAGVGGSSTVRTGTAQAGAAATITLDAGASATNDLYAGEWVQITAGTGAGQTRFILSYVGSTKVASVAPNWKTNPDATSVFSVLPAAGVDLEAVQGAAPTATGGTVDASITKILGTSLSEGGAGRLAAALTHFLDVPSPLLTASSVNQTGDAYGSSATNATTLAAVKAKTDNLPVDPASQTTAAAIQAKTDSLTFTTAGKVDAKLTADGLDNLDPSVPAGPATTFRGRLMQAWGRFFYRSRKTAVGIETYRADGTTLNTTQAYTSAGGVDDVQAAA